jgi:DNA-binding CsgD family transcriptional regulator
VVRAWRSGCDVELLDRLYEASFEPKGWPAFLLGLERFLGGGVAMLCMPAPSPDRPGTVVAPSLNPSFVESYGAHHFRQDPWLRDAHATAVGEVVHPKHDAQGERLAETPFHREWMKPQGLVAHGLLHGVVDRHADGTCALITVFRSGGSGPARGAADSLRELMAHIRRALRAHTEHARLHAERASLAAALDHLPLALIVVDRHHRVHLSNRDGSSLLARRDGLILDREGLHGSRPEDDARLRRALVEVCNGAPGAATGRTLTLARTSGRAPLRARVLRVPVPEGGSAESLALLFVSDREAEVELPTAALSCLYGLTPAETALVRELANDRSIQEAAVRLGITIGTARQRLVQIFDKTGTTRQASLVRLVLTGPEGLSTRE